MSSDKSITLYTVPSVWVNQWSSKTTVPYGRVVGIKTKYLSMWAVEYENGDPEVKYSRDEATPTTIQLPPILQTRLFSFFKRYFAVQPDIKDRYNCHRFAYWMIGRKGADTLERPRAPYPSTKNKTISKGGIAVGNQGLWILNNGKKSVHSVIGLGEDTDMFLQVLAHRGYLALVDYKTIKKYYGNEFKGEVELYVS